MGNPKNRLIVRNSQERRTYIEEYVKTNPIYITVYPFKKIIKEDLYEMHKYAQVKWVVLDLDPDDCEPYEEMMRIHKIALENNKLHRIHLSGRGFHVFIFIESNLKYPKIAIANFWDYLHGDKHGKYENPFDMAKYYESPKLGICDSTRGDLARIIRFPNTYNFKSNCYCITLDSQALSKCTRLEQFQSLARVPYKPTGDIYFGEDRWDISEFDCTEEQYKNLGSTHLHMSNIDYGNIEINKEVEFDYEDMPHCMRYIIEHVDLHFPERNELIKFLINRTDLLIPYYEEDVMGVLWKLRKKNKWLNWFFQHSREDIIYRNVKVIQDNIHIMSGCFKISSMGYCNRAECEWNNITEKNNDE